MKFDYPKICKELLKNVPQKQQEVILRRFNLSSKADFNPKKRETLESIGSDFVLTRERIRQIEKDGLSILKPRLGACQKVFQHFKGYFQEAGDLKKEEALLADLGGKKHKAHVFFLLTLGENFKRFPETDELHPAWGTNQKSLLKAQRLIGSLCQHLEKVKKPLAFSDLKSFFSPVNVSPKALENFLEISRVIQKNQEGLFGLKDWPEINPKSVKDKAILTLRKVGKPLHFQDLTKLIGPEALPQTVHNELIRHPHFVLVGRGTYALKEWGYEQGHVKDVIAKILAKEGRPLSKDEVVKEVLKQRLVKTNTVLLNLSNKRHFFRTPEGKYTILSGVKEA